MNQRIELSQVGNEESSGRFGYEAFLHNPIRYAEIWEPAEALQTHIRSDLYPRRLAAIELSKHKPEVKYYCCYKTKGIEMGAFIGGVVAKVTEIGLGLGPVLINQEDLLFTLNGGLLVLGGARWVTC